MSRYCKKCGMKIIEGAMFCSHCGLKIEAELIPPQQSSQTQTISESIPEPKPLTTQPVPVKEQVQSSHKTPTYPTQHGIWFQNYYKIRKKVVTVGNKYWIEDNNGNVLGFCKQKILRLKEDIRIFTDESLNKELFRIKQEQILDAWGNFAVIDSNTEIKLGYVKREWLSSAFAKDKYEIYTANNELIGKIEETSTGHALARKYLPGGALVPEKMTIELNGVPVAEVNQQFKIIGDIWEMNCIQVPPEFDRRVLLGTMLLMGTIERDRK